MGEPLTITNHHVGSVRILEIGRDPLFKVAYPERTDWVSTGRPIEPINRHLSSTPTPTISLSTAANRLRRGHYELAMVPAIQARTPTDGDWSRKAIRRMLTYAGRRRLLVGLFGKASGLEATRHFVRDVSDYPYIGESDAGLFPEALIYAKREVLASDLGQPAHGASGGTVIYLPMPFDLKRYRQWMVEQPEKTMDVFFVGKLHSPQRILAREAAEKLAERGWRVDLPTERLPYSEYLARLSRSWLVLSPRGHGEHCYRHYEALLMGSVPVINQPELPIHYSLEHSQTALFHRPTVEDLVSLCEESLADPGRLRRIADAGRRLVEDEHDIHTLASRLLDLASVSDWRE